ncbi:MAG: hypothetical protein IKD04_03805 [Clostridia bacterium]|nr:hypothetical protein [Clostridia bacterium]
MKNSKRLIALVLSLSLLFSVCGCREIRWTAKDDEIEYYYTTSDIINEEETSTYSFPYETLDEADFTVSSHLPGEFALISPNRLSLICNSVRPEFKWSVSEWAESYILIVEQYDSKTQTFNELFRESGIETTTYTVKRDLPESEILRWCVVAQNKYGKKYSSGVNDNYYEAFISYVDSKNHPATAGMDFKFDYKISREVLCNYLSRAVTAADDLTFLSLDNLKSISILNNVLYTGAKYVSRAGCVWTPRMKEINSMPGQKEFIALAHKYDPDIIFEACLFENVDGNVNEIPIPDWVFRAFGLTPEKRNFNFGKIVHSGSTIPDMTKLEAQMLFYYRGTLYIDAGYEAFHMGQIDIISSKEYGTWECTAKVFNMLRDYANKNARRHFILINAHTPYNDNKSYVSTLDNKLIYDFICFPLRATTNESTPHPPSANKPQTQYLKVGNGDSLFGRAFGGGMTHSGWYAETLPYYIEFDNASNTNGLLDIPTPNIAVNWGRDDIGWFASQPASYRSYWLDYAYSWLKELKNEYNEDAFVCMPIFRPATPYGYTSRTFYDASCNLLSSNGYSDIFAIRDIWIKNNS